MFPFSVLQPQAAHGDAFLAEEAPDGKAGRKMPDAQKGVLPGEKPVGIGRPVADDDVVEGDGVERPDRNAAHRDVSVDLVRQHRDRLSGEGRLDGGGLHGDDKGQQQNDYCRQDPKRYAKSLFH